MNIEEIVTDWESTTGYRMEWDEYAGLYQLDVNNYIAKTTSGKVKKKAYTARC